MRKTPMRKCVVTNEHWPKKDLIRIVRTTEGKIEIDPTGRKNGRGAYMKLDSEVIALAEKKKILNRVFETEVPGEIYEELRQLIQ